MSERVNDVINQFWTFNLPPQWDAIGLSLFFILTIVGKSFDILREHNPDNVFLKILSENTLNTLNSLIALMFTEALYNTRFMEDYARTKMLFLVTLLVVLFYTPRQTKRSVIAKLWGVLEEKIHLKLDSITLSTQELRNLQTTEFNELRAKYYDLMEKLNDVQQSKREDKTETKNSPPPKSKPSEYFNEGRATEMCCQNRELEEKRENGGHDLKKTRDSKETKDSPEPNDKEPKRST
jgi:hypothetical protein